MLPMFIALAAAQADVKAGPPKIMDAHFLVTDGQSAPIETTNVPYRPNASCYTWVLSVAPENRNLSVREVFQLPASARTWGDDPTGITAVNNDRSTAVTEFIDSLGDGLISHGWCVIEGDPAGPHRIRVFAGDVLLHEFRFNVVEQPY